MSVTVRSALVILALTSLSSRSARADESADRSKPDNFASAECARDYEQAQEQRQAGKLLEARAELELCARDACPEFIRTDCVAWYADIQAELPTVVFAARSAGQDLSDVRVAVGPRVLTARLDGQPVALDPGEYELEFSARGMQSLAQHVLISRGERNRLLRVELSPVLSPNAASSPTHDVPPRSWLLPGVLGGVAVLGLSGFAVFGAWGHSAESKLESTCLPDCRKDQISSVRTKYAVADVSLVVGVASLALGTYFALSSRGERGAATHTAQLALHAGSRSLSASYQGAF